MPFRTANILQLMLEPDLTVALALSEVTQMTEADEVAGMLVRIFEVYDKTISLLRASIEAEVNRTDQSATLFRRNSMCTKLLAAFSKVNGREFLKDLLHPIIQELISNPLTCEVIDC
jgi:neurofibromin 1